MRSSLVMKQPVCQVTARRSQLDAPHACARIIAMKTLLKRLLGLGVLAAAGYAVWRALRATQGRHRRHVGPAAVPVPAAAAHRAPRGAGTPRRRADRRDRRRDAAWVEPDAGACPDVAPGEGEAGERDLPRSRRRELRPHASRTAATSLAEAAETDGLRPAQALARHRPFG